MVISESSFWFGFSCVLQTELAFPKLARKKFGNHTLFVTKNVFDDPMNKFLSNSMYQEAFTSLFVNGNDTILYFGTWSKSTMHYIGAHTLPDISFEHRNCRLTACASDAGRNTNIGFFLLLKGRPNGRAGKPLYVSIRTNVLQCCQKSLDRMTMHKSVFEKSGGHESSRLGM